MRFALSTNWNNHRLTTGEAIVDEALALGFDALELGYNTTPEQVTGFKLRLDEMPVESVHAYAPVPPGAPTGHPELYQLTAPDEDQRGLARFFIRKSLALAAECGAKALVFHAGYVDLGARFGDVFSGIAKRRRVRGLEMLDLFSREFEGLADEFTAAGVTFALENLPRENAFPHADEAAELMKRFAGAPLRLWFDTGHARVCEMNKWSGAAADVAAQVKDWVIGMHLNDVKDVRDDHFAPGDGNVDFAALKDMAAQAGVLHVVESHPHVTREQLERGLAKIRALWN